MTSHRGTGMAPRRQPHIPLQRWLLLAAALLWLSGCSVLARKRAQEQENPYIAGRQFEIIAVIAGGPSRPQLQMSARG